METIGKYQIEKKIGQGGMGIVYKCVDPENNRPTAVKVLPQQLAADPGFLQRFKREVMTLQRLDHPNIIKVYDQGEHHGAWFYAMEFAEGTSLEAILENGQKLEPLRAIRIIRACAEALSHSHALGVVHRDIKPANIMLGPDDTVKLMDFGIAKVLDATRMTMTQGVLGTVEYMSPEQSQGRAVDGRSDIYSLGVVLYRCLTGKLPISGSNPTEVIMRLRTQQVDSPIEWAPEIPRRLNDLVMRMLEKEPTRRVESAKELMRELETVEGQIIKGETGQRSRDVNRIITTGAPARNPLLNPWMLAFVALAIGVGIWIANKHGGGAAATDAQQPTAAQIATDDENTSPSHHPVLLLSWARRAFRQERYEYAEDLCKLIVKYHPESEQAKNATMIIENIEKRKAEAAAEKENPHNNVPPPASSETKE